MFVSNQPCIIFVSSNNSFYLKTIFCGVIILVLFIINYSFLHAATDNTNRTQQKKKSLAIFYIGNIDKLVTLASDVLPQNSTQVVASLKINALLVAAYWVSNICHFCSALVVFDNPIIFVCGVQYG